MGTFVNVGRLKIQSKAYNSIKTKRGKMGFTIYWTWIEPPDKDLFAQWTVDVQKLVANFNQNLDLVDTPLEDEVKSVITEQKVAFTNDKFEAF